MKVQIMKALVNAYDKTFSRHKDRLTSTRHRLESYQSLSRQSKLLYAFSIQRKKNKGKNFEHVKVADLRIATSIIKFLDPASSQNRVIKRKLNRALKNYGINYKSETLIDIVCCWRSQEKSWHEGLDHFLYTEYEYPIVGEYQNSVNAYDSAVNNYIFPFFYMLVMKFDVGSMVKVKDNRNDGSFQLQTICEINVTDNRPNLSTVSSSNQITRFEFTYQYLYRFQAVNDSCSIYIENSNDFVFHALSTLCIGDVLANDYVSNVMRVVRVSNSSDKQIDLTLEEEEQTTKGRVHKKFVKFYMNEFLDSPLCIAHTDNVGQILAPDFFVPLIILNLHVRLGDFDWKSCPLLCNSIIQPLWNIVLEYYCNF